MRLREKLATLVGSCIHHYSSKVLPTIEVANDLTITRTEIGMMLNVDEQDHAALEKALSELIDVLRMKHEWPVYQVALNKVISYSRAVLRSEWQRAKAGE
jgi:hypothetical protein